MTPFPTLLAPNFGETAWRWLLVPAEYQDNARRMLQLAERAREAGGDVPVTVTSWYRPALLNAAVGGSKTSQHLSASGMDFRPSINPREWFNRLRANLDPSEFGQLVYHEATDGHVHLGLPNLPNGRHGEVLVEIRAGSFRNLTTSTTVAGDLEGRANQVWRVVVYSGLALAALALVLKVVR